MVLRASTWTASARALSRHQSQSGRGRAEPSGGTGTSARVHRLCSDSRWQTCARLARRERRPEGKTRVRQKPEFLHSYVPTGPNFCKRDLVRIAQEIALTEPKRVDIALVRYDVVATLAAVILP